MDKDLIRFHMLSLTTQAIMIHEIGYQSDTIKNTIRLYMTKLITINYHYLKISNFNVKKRINKLLILIEDLQDFAESTPELTYSIGKEIWHYRNRIRRLKNKYGIK